MTVELSDELREALGADPPEPVRLVDSRTNATFVVLPAEEYARIQALLDDAHDEQVQKAWLEMASRTRRAWVLENPY